MNEFEFNLEREIQGPPEEIFELIEDGTFFKFTGGNEVKIDFIVNGLYSILFAQGGIIEGKFSDIKDNMRVDFTWNVKGFRKNDDIDTKVTVSFESKENKSILKLSHSGIKTEESYLGKLNGWSGVLDSLMDKFEN